jgi:hypothetical protein
VFVFLKQRGDLQVKVAMAWPRVASILLVAVGVGAKVVVDGEAHLMVVDVDLASQNDASHDAAECGVGENQGAVRNSSLEHDPLITSIVFDDVSVEMDAVTVLFGAPPVDVDAVGALVGPADLDGLAGIVLLEVDLVRDGAEVLPVQIHLVGEAVLGVHLDFGLGRLTIQEEGDAGVGAVGGEHGQRGEEVAVGAIGVGDAIGVDGAVVVVGALTRVASDEGQGENGQKRENAHDDLLLSRLQKWSAGRSGSGTHLYRGRIYPYITGSQTDGESALCDKERLHVYLTLIKLHCQPIEPVSVGFS